jgi:CubicO group peptidase (beta-lactamase class C family)
MRGFLFAMVLLLAARPVQCRQLDAEARAGIDRVFAEYDRSDGPGCAVGVVREGALVFAKGYGVGQLDQGSLLTPSSVFYLASVSKQFTAAAVLIAEREGYLALDDDIRRWIHEMPDYGAPITVRHLLHHTSGVRDYLTLMGLAGTPLANVLSDQAMLGLIARQRELNFEPGSEHLYSNSGYVLLAEIVKRATGRSLHEYADEKLFRPLGMRSTHFHDDRRHVVPGRVFSYDAGPDGAWRTNYLMNFDKVGDGGLYSTVEDLSRWDRAFYEDLLGVPDFAAKMYTRGVLTSGDTIDYARGLSHSVLRGLPAVTHGGSLMAFRTFIGRFPEQRVTIITLCNDGSANSGRLSTAVAEVVMADDVTEEAPTPATADQDDEPEEPPHSVSESALRGLAGTYRSEELESTWIVRTEGGELILDHPGEGTGALRATGERTFIGPYDIELNFVGEGGRADAFVVQAGRVRNLRFERVR